MLGFLVYCVETQRFKMCSKLIGLCWTTLVWTASLTEKLGNTFHGVLHHMQHFQNRCVLETLSNQYLHSHHWGLPLLSFCFHISFCLFIFISFVFISTTFIDTIVFLLLSGIVCIGVYAPSRVGTGWLCVFFLLWMGPAAFCS